MKKQKNYQSGSAPIYMRFTVSGRRSETTAGLTPLKDIFSIIPLKLMLHTCYNSFDSEL